MKYGKLSPPFFKEGWPQHINCKISEANFAAGVVDFYIRYV